MDVRCVERKVAYERKKSFPLAIREREVYSSVLYCTVVVVVVIVIIVECLT